MPDFVFAYIFVFSLLRRRHSIQRTSKQNMGGSIKKYARIREYAYVIILKKLTNLLYILEIPIEK